MERIASERPKLDDLMNWADDEWLVLSLITPGENGAMKAQFINQIESAAFRSNALQMSTETNR